MESFFWRDRALLLQRIPSRSEGEVTGFLVAICSSQEDGTIKINAATTAVAWACALSIGWSALAFPVVTCLHLVSSYYQLQYPVDRRERL